MNPSYQSFATHDESEYPELWDRCTFSVAPCLGSTGSKLHDLATKGSWGDLGSNLPASTWEIYQQSYSLRFDGTNLRPVRGVANGADPSRRPISLCFWYRGAVANKTRHWVYSNGPTNSPSIGVVIERVSDTEHRLALFSGAYTRSGSFSWDLEWHHYAITWQSDDVCRMYRDRKLIFEGSRSASATVVGLWEFNALTIEPGFNMNGNLAQFSAYERILSPADIATLGSMIGIEYTPRRRRKAYFLGPTFSPAWARGSNVILQPAMGVG